MTNWKQDAVIACFLGGFSTLFYILAKGYPADANTFPLILCVLLGLLSFCLGFQALVGARNAARSGGGKVRFVEWIWYKRVFVQLLIIAAFILLIHVVSFPLAGVLLCFATACNGAYPNKKFAIIFSIGTSAFVFVAFKILLEVPLPLAFFE